MLTLDGITVSHGGVTALADVSLDVGDHEFVVLLGANGAGKTTLLKAASGLVRAQRGEIRLGGTPIHRLPPHAIARLGIAHVPEGRQVFATLTTFENLELGGYQWRHDRGILHETLTRVLALFPQLAARETQLAGTLSGGEQQMLAIGRALMSRPKLLMLDEPSLGLAPLVVRELFDFLERLHRDQGLAILLVEQAAALALTFAERGYVLENGRIALSGSATELRADQRVRDVYLGAAVGS